MNFLCFEDDELSLMIQAINNLQICFHHKYAPDGKFSARDLFELQREENDVMILADNNIISPIFEIVRNGYLNNQERMVKVALFLTWTKFLNARVTCGLGLLENDTSHLNDRSAEELRHQFLHAVDVIPSQLWKALAFGAIDRIPDAFLYKSNAVSKADYDSSDDLLYLSNQAAIIKIVQLLKTKEKNGIDLFVDFMNWYTDHLDRSAHPQAFVNDFKARYGRETTQSDIMERYRNAFENTGDSQKSSEAMFARKVILVEGESEVLILPYLFSLCGYDEVAEGVTIVRCGGKSELDRYYRLYSEFGIPVFIIFDGDYQNVGKEDEGATIAKNKGILRLFNIDDSFPDGTIHENHLGFVYRLEENLGIDGIGNAKALSLYRRVKKEITSHERVPHWVVEVISAIKKLPTEATSVLEELPPPSEFNILDF